MKMKKYDIVNCSTGKVECQVWSYPDRIQQVLGWHGFPYRVETRFEAKLSTTQDESQQLKEVQNG